MPRPKSRWEAQQLEAGPSRAALGTTGKLQAAEKECEWRGRAACAPLALLKCSVYETILLK